MRPCILADNQFITSRGISVLLEKIGINAIVIAKTKNELQKKLSVFPDALVILDYALFDFVSMQQMLIVKAAAKESVWILFSNDTSEQFLRYVLISDPSINIVMKYDTEENIMAALCCAIDNTRYICELAEYILNNFNTSETKTNPIKLTVSEKSILREIARGKTTKEIAYEKNLSFHTVNSHRKNIFRKLEINNVHDAVKYAIRAGILDAVDYYI